VTPIWRLIKAAGSCGKVVVGLPKIFREHIRVKGARQTWKTPSGKAIVGSTAEKHMRRK